jgi:hypothetical protein
VPLSSIDPLRSPLSQVRSVYDGSLFYKMEAKISGKKVGSQYEHCGEGNTWSKMMSARRAKELTKEQ